MRWFIILSVFIHIAAASIYILKPSDKTLRLPPPLSTNIELEQPQQTPTKSQPEDPKNDSLVKKFKRLLSKKKTQKVKPKKTETSTLGTPQKELLYGQKLQAFIEHNRSYPIRALRLKQEGTVKVMLTILKDGKFKNVKIISPSKHTALNKATQSLISSLKYFDPLPNQSLNQQEFTVPISYEIED